jgi:predicted ATPase
MKPTVYALISETSGNCIAICANVEDAIGLQGDYDYRGSAREPQMRYEVKPVTRQEAEELLRRQWVDMSTGIEITAQKAS